MVVADAILGDISQSVKRMWRLCIEATIWPVAIVNVIDVGREREGGRDGGRERWREGGRG